MTALLVADRIGDPGNMGTMVRTAAAVGAGLWATAGSADLFDPKTLRATAGTVFVLPVRQRVGADEVIAWSRRGGRRLVGRRRGRRLALRRGGLDVSFHVGHRQRSPRRPSAAFGRGGRGGKSSAGAGRGVFERGRHRGGLFV